MIVVDYDLCRTRFGCSIYCRNQSLSENGIDKCSRPVCISECRGRLDQTNNPSMHFCNIYTFLYVDHNDHRSRYRGLVVHAARAKFRRLHLNISPTVPLLRWRKAKQDWSKSGIIAGHGVSRTTIDRLRGNGPFLAVGRCQWAAQQSGIGRTCDYPVTVVVSILTTHFHWLLQTCSA